MTSNFIGWKEFHSQLDMAMAFWITEGGLKETRYPSKTSLLTFAGYTNQKQLSEKSKAFENRCPFCNGTNLDFDSIEPEGEEMCQGVDCHDCERHFRIWSSTRWEFGDEDGIYADKEVEELDKEINKLIDFSYEKAGQPVTLNQMREEKKEGICFYCGKILYEKPVWVDEHNHWFCSQEHIDIFIGLRKAK